MILSAMNLVSHRLTTIGQHRGITRHLSARHCGLTYSATRQWHVERNKQICQGKLVFYSSGKSDVVELFARVRNARS